MENVGERVKLVACDLDGTLLGPGGYGFEDAKKAVDLCRQNGIHFTIATGRVFGAVERYLKYLDIKEPVITNGGGLVASVGSSPIFEKTIEKDLAHEIALELKKLNLPFYFLVGTDMITEWKGPETKIYSQNLGYEIEVVPSVRHVKKTPTQIVLRVPPEKADSLLEELSYKWQPKLSVTKSLPHLIEIQAPGVSKSKGLQFLAGKLGVDREEVLAIGDSLNDLDMLSWAGKRACVGNAHPLVRRCVSVTAKTKYSEGVLEILQKFIGQSA